jgi:hypothetical protein
MFALGKLLSFEMERGRMSAQQSDYQPGVSVTRSFALDAQSVVDVIEVRRDRSTGETMGTILQLDCETHLPQLISKSQLTLPAEAGFGYWKQTGTYRLPAKLEFTASCGKMDFRIRVEGPIEGLMLVGKPPVLDNHDRNAIYLRYPVSQGRIRTTYTQLAPTQNNLLGAQPTMKPEK